MDTRRSRMHRKRLGKKIRPSDRDLEIFKTLRRYRYLRSTFIHAFVGGNDLTFFKKRLGDLFHEAWLDRPVQQWNAYNARYAPAIYELDEKAEEYLKAQGIEEYASDLVRRGRMGATRQFAHAMMICDTLASIELGARESSVRFISWEEILERAPEKTRNADNPFSIPVSISHNGHHATTKIIHDALFGLEYQRDDKKVYRFFALEAERMNRISCSNLSQTSWLKKVLSYRYIAKNKIYHSHLGIPNLMALAVAANDTKVANMKALTAEVTSHTKMFAFRSVPTITSLETPKLEPVLFTKPWSRAGHEDFYINQ